MENKKEQFIVNTQTEEARQKAIETRKNNLPQMSNREEREAHISIDYADKTVHIYTNNAVVMSRLARRGISHYKESLLDGQVYDREYKLPLDQIGLIAMAGIFK